MNQQINKTSDSTLLLDKHKNTGGDNINQTTTDKQIWDKGSDIEQTPPLNPKPTFYAYVVLGLLLLIYISNQWQRSTIAYASAYKVDPYQNDPYYNINKDISGFKENYGYLAGASFTIPISVVGIFMGALSDMVNRKVMVTVACMLWSLMTILQAFAKEIWVLFVCRFALGIFQAACNPPAYSIMADYFHPQYRTTANSIYSLGIYLGGALSSLAILIITGAGWRWMFRIIGFIGLGAGAVGFIFIREPERNYFENLKKKQQSIQNPSLLTSQSIQPAKPKANPLALFLRACKEIFVNPTCRYVCIAGSFRFFGGYAIGYFMPQYFAGVYPDYFKVEYSIANSFVVSLGGFISAMSGGIISDKFEKRIRNIKALVCIFAGVLGCPTIAVCLLYQHNFWVSITFLFLEYVVAECWTSPAITMLINTISPENKGFAVSAYLFFTTLAGTLSTFLLGEFKNVWNMDEHPEYIGYTLCAFVFFSYLGSIPGFIMAGKSYKEFLEKKKEAEEQEKRNS
eukprot:403365495